MTLMPTDPAAGDWIAPRLAPFGSCFGAVVPQGFEAYVRILHPVQVAADRWVGWADVAAHAGTHLEALSPFWRVAGLTGYREHADAAPLEGNLPEHAFLALTDTLAAESVAGRQTACVAALWHGWGHLHGPGTGSIAWLGHGAPVPDPPAPPAGPFPREVLDGPTLELPGREYWTFACTLATADAPGRYDQWRPGDRAGWQSPQLLWPQDRSWCVATEVDPADDVVLG